jgi:hypothetical protein
MAVAQPWKRPELADQPALKKLNDELHDLRLDAGLPSARAIRDRIGRDVDELWIVNHQAVLDTFQKPGLPQLGRLELIVGVLAKDARRNNLSGEVDRFKAMWKKAFAETVTQAPLQAPADTTELASDEDTTTADVSSVDPPTQDSKGENGRASEELSPITDAPSNDNQAAEQVEYAWESLKGLILNAAQALWDDKDALRIFLGVVRRSERFVRMADAVEGMEVRPPNATYLGVESREFEMADSPARHELVTLHRCLDQHRLKKKWSFSDMEERTGVSADVWIRWNTREELPEREALVAFSHAARLQLDDHVLLLGLWDAARDALEARRRSDVLPSNISFDEAWAMRDPAGPKLWALVGVDADGLTAYGADLASGTAPAFVVAGPPGSGRSTALVNIARSLLASGARLVLAAPRPSPLRKLADQDGVMACFLQADINHDELEQILAVASIEEPVVIVMDDAEDLSKCDASRLLVNLLQHGFEEGIALALAGDEDKLNLFARWLDGAKKAHRGLLLSPQKWNAGDLIGIRTGRSIISSTVTPGRGWLHLGDGKLLAVTVPR